MSIKIELMAIAAKSGIISGDSVITEAQKEIIDLVSKAIAAYENIALLNGDTEMIERANTAKAALSKKAYETALRLIQND
jgi:hypothetical protein